ncbi:MAG: DNA-binding domain-containing protein, partial [Bacteroidota bacterium]
MNIKRDNQQQNAVKSFAEIQQWMQQQLMHPQFSGDYETYVNSTSKLSAKQHVQIYQRSYIARLRDCMEAQFPALCYALGRPLFLQFADWYLLEYPSKSYTLGDLGQYFGQFLAETRPDKEAAVKESWPDFMIELAKFEFLVNTSFDEKAAENHQIATPESDESRLQLVPVCYILQHNFPISEYYKAAVNERKPELPFAQESHCVLLRRNYRLGLFELTPLQYHFLKKLQQSNSISASKQFLIKTYA